MKRRELLVAGSVGFGGILLPNFVRAAMPCPPPSLSLDGEGSVTTSCATTGSGTSLRLTSAVGGTLLPFTVGHPFRQGDIPAGQFIASDLATFQADVRNRWPDGSVKFAVLSGRKTMSAGVTSTVQVNKSSVGPGGTNLNEADLIALSPVANITLSGVGTVTLASLLGSPVRSFLGPQMSEFHYKSAVGGDAHLVVFFHVRLYAGDEIEIETIVENGYVNVAGPTSKAYSVTLSINGTTRYSASLTHKHHTRWAMPFWYSSDPQITPKHDGAYLRATKLVPNYGNASVSAGLLNGYTQTIVPFQLADYVTPMGNAGYQPTIGLLMEWDVAYIIGQDVRAYKAVIANGYAAGRYPTHYRDESTGRPIRVLSYIGWGLGDAAGYNSQGAVEAATLPSNSGGVNDSWDLMHSPAIGYLAYLLTGRWYFIEEMQFTTTFNYLGQSYSNTYSSRRDSALHTLFHVQAGSSTGRGAAWALRTLAMVCAITPDSDSVLRTEFISHYQDNVDWYYRTYAAPGVGNALGIYKDYVNYESGSGHTSQSAWQDDFFTMALGMGRDIVSGMSAGAQSQLNALTLYKYKHRVGIYGGGGSAAWCYLDGAPYFVRVSDVEGASSIAEFNSTVYADWGTAYAKSIGPNASCPIGGALRGSSGSDPTAAGTGYWGNSQPAIAYAVDHGAPGAAAAYAKITGASNWSAVAASFNDAPVWYVVPR